MKLQWKIGKKDVDYALFRKAEALGPLRKFEEKAQTLHLLLEKYPHSIYAGNAEYALASLEFAPNKAAGIISKVIASAVANGDYEPEEVEVISCRVDKGPVLKRFRPRARGSASRILKPTSHIMVEVGPVKKDETTKKTTKKDA